MDRDTIETMSNSPVRRHDKPMGDSSEPSDDETLTLRRNKFTGPISHGFSETEDMHDRVHERSYDARSAAGNRYPSFIEADFAQPDTSKRLEENDPVKTAFSLSTLKEYRPKPLELFSPREASREDPALVPDNADNEGSGNYDSDNDADSIKSLHGRESGFTLTPSGSRSSFEVIAEEPAGDLRPNAEQLLPVSSSGFVANFFHSNEDGGRKTKSLGALSPGGVTARAGYLDADPVDFIAASLADAETGAVFMESANPGLSDVFSSDQLPIGTDSVMSYGAFPAETDSRLVWTEELTGHERLASEQQFGFSWLQTDQIGDIANILSVLEDLRSSVRTLSDTGHGGTDDTLEALSPSSGERVLYLSSPCNMPPEVAHNLDESEAEMDEVRTNSARNDDSIVHGLNTAVSFNQGSSYQDNEEKNLFSQRLPMYCESTNRNAHMSFEGLERTTSSKNGNKTVDGSVFLSSGSLRDRSPLSSAISLPASSPRWPESDLKTTTRSNNNGRNDHVTPKPAPLKDFNVGEPNLEPNSAVLSQSSTYLPSVSKAYVSRPDSSASSSCSTYEASFGGRADELETAAENCKIPDEGVHVKHSAASAASTAVEITDGNINEIVIRPTNQPSESEKDTAATDFLSGYESDHSSGLSTASSVNNFISAPQLQVFGSISMDDLENNDVSNVSEKFSPGFVATLNERAESKIPDDQSSAKYSDQSRWNSMVSTAVNLQCSAGNERKSSSTAPFFTKPSLESEDIDSLDLNQLEEACGQCCAYIPQFENGVHWEIPTLDTDLTPAVGGDDKSIGPAKNIEASTLESGRTMDRELVKPTVSEAAAQPCTMQNDTEVLLLTDRLCLSTAVVKSAGAYPEATSGGILSPQVTENTNPQPMPDDVGDITARTEQKSGGSSLASSIPYSRVSSLIRNYEKQLEDISPARSVSTKRARSAEQPLLVVQGTARKDQIKLDPSLDHSERSSDGSSGFSKYTDDPFSPASAELSNQKIFEDYSNIIATETTDHDLRQKLALLTPSDAGEDLPLQIPLEMEAASKEGSSIAQEYDSLIEEMWAPTLQENAEGSENESRAFERAKSGATHEEAAPLDYHRDLGSPQNDSEFAMNYSDAAVFSPRAERSMESSHTGRENDEITKIFPANFLASGATKETDSLEHFASVLDAEIEAHEFIKARYAAEEVQVHSDANRATSPDSSSDTSQENIACISTDQGPAAADSNNPPALSDPRVSPYFELVGKVQPLANAEEEQSSVTRVSSSTGECEEGESGVENSLTMEEKSPSNCIATPTAFPTSISPHQLNEKWKQELNTHSGLLLKASLEEQSPGDLPPSNEMSNLVEHSHDVAPEKQDASEFQLVMNRLNSKNTMDDGTADALVDVVDALHFAALEVEHLFLQAENACHPHSPAESHPPSQVQQRPELSDQPQVYDGATNDPSLENNALDSQLCTTVGGTAKGYESDNASTVESAELYQRSLTDDPETSARKGASLFDLVSDSSSEASDGDTAEDGEYFTSMEPYYVVEEPPEDLEPYVELDYSISEESAEVIHRKQMYEHEVSDRPDWRLADHLNDEEIVKCHPVSASGDVPPDVLQSALNIIFARERLNDVRHTEDPPQNAETIDMSTSPGILVTNTLTSGQIFQHDFHKDHQILHHCEAKVSVFDLPEGQSEPSVHDPNSPNQGQKRRLMKSSGRRSWYKLADLPLEMTIISTVPRSISVTHEKLQPISAKSEVKSGSRTEHNVANPAGSRSVESSGFMNSQDDHAAKTAAEALYQRIVAGATSHGDLAIAEPKSTLTGEPTDEYLEKFDELVSLKKKEWDFDKNAVDPYKQVLDIQVDENEGEPAMVLMYPCLLPDHTDPQYDHIMENLHMFILGNIQKVEKAPFRMVYFNASVPHGCEPPATWLQHLYKSMSQTMKDNLLQLLVVHPNFKIKAQLHTAGRATLSKEFYRKIEFVKGLKELGRIQSVHYAAIPKPVRDFDRKREWKLSRNPCTC